MDELGEGLRRDERKRAKPHAVRLWMRPCLPFLSQSHLHSPTNTPSFSTTQHSFLLHHPSFHPHPAMQIFRSWLIFSLPSFLFRSWDHLSLAKFCQQSDLPAEKSYFPTAGQKRRDGRIRFCWRQRWSRSEAVTSVMRQIGIDLYTPGFVPLCFDGVFDMISSNSNHSSDGKGPFILLSRRSQLIRPFVAAGVGECRGQSGVARE